MPTSKQPIPGFTKNWFSRHSSNGQLRYYFARGDYYSHVQDAYPTQEDHEEQLRMSEEKREQGKPTQRKKERHPSQRKRLRNGFEADIEAEFEHDDSEVQRAIAEVEAQHAKEAQAALAKRAAKDAAAEARTEMEHIQRKVQDLFYQYKQHQIELVRTCGAVVQDRPAYYRVSLVGSTSRPVHHQEVVDAIFRHIDYIRNSSIKDVRVVGDVSNDVRITFRYWDSHTTDAIQQLLRWSDGFAFTSMAIFRFKPVADPSHRLFVCNIPYDASSDDLTTCLFRGLDRHQLVFGPRASEPLAGCTMQRGFAFVECKDASVATACLSLDGIDLFGRSLRIERPKNYKGPVTESEN